MKKFQILQAQKKQVFAVKEKALQVMTAEEKRLLSGFTHDERKKKEEIVLQQFRSFIESKKAKN